MYRTRSKRNKSIVGTPHQVSKELGFRSLKDSVGKIHTIENKFDLSLGINDKNGNEIFNGDKLQFPWGESIAEWFGSGYKKGIRTEKGFTESYYVDWDECTILN